MFLGRRTTQAEYFDSARPAQEISEFYRSLERLNRLFVFAEPFQRMLPRLLGENQCRSLSVLDLGAGDGSLAQVLSKWALQRGWLWRFTSLDLSAEALRLVSEGNKVAGSVLALPFASNSFDVVIASQMTHHLADGEASQHLREAWRVSRQGVLVSDLHRNFVLYLILWMLFCVQRFPQVFRSDGLLSVRKAWRVPELRQLAQQAGIPEARVSLYFGARVLLQARKKATPTEAGCPLA